MSASSFKWLFVFLFILADICVVGQTPAWERINPIPFENNINGSQILNNGTLVVVGNSGSIFRSQDMGNSWESLYPPLGKLTSYSLNTVHFVDNEIGYASGTQLALLKTENGGNNWEEISTPTGNVYDVFHGLFFLTADSGFIIKNRHQILRTTNGCQSWEVVGSSDSLEFGRVEFFDHSNGYITLSGTNGYFRTMDGGNNWFYTPLNIPIENFQVSSLHFTDINVGHIAGYEGSDRKIFKTKNAGDSCYLVHEEWVWTFGRFTFPNRDTGFITATMYPYSNCLLRTTDAGESWVVISDNLGGWNLNTLQMNTSGIGLCLGSNGQTFRSNDYGASWENNSSYSFLFKMEVDDAIIIDDSSIIAEGFGGGGGVPDGKNVRSDDRGATWQYDDELPCIVNSLVYINDSIGFCTSDYGGYYDLNFIYKTIDGGLNWEQSWLEPRDIYPERIQFLNDSIGFVGGGNLDPHDGFTLYRTMNQGESWQLIDHEYIDYVGWNSSFDFFNDSSAYIVGDTYFGGNDAHVLRTNNLGDSWDVDTLPFLNDFYDVRFFNNDTGFLFGFDKVCRTLDGGLNWNLIALPYDYNTQEKPVFNLVGEHSAYLKIYRKEDDHWFSSMIKSIDAGESWFEVDIPTNTSCLALAFFDENEGVWLGKSGTIFRTSTGGMVRVPDWEIDEKESLFIYPNPSHGTVAVKIPDDYNIGILSIYDLQGKILASQKYRNESELFLNLNLNRGIYLLSINNGISYLTGKLIVMGR